MNWKGETENNLRDSDSDHDDRMGKQSSKPNVFARFLLVHFLLTQSYFAKFSSPAAAAAAPAASAAAAAPAAAAAAPAAVAAAAAPAATAHKVRSNVDFP
jgi:hypothetical protein